MVVWFGEPILGEITTIKLSRVKSFTNSHLHTPLTALQASLVIPCMHLTVSSSVSLHSAKK